jgi:hypothetical protein
VRAHGPHAIVNTFREAFDVALDAIEGLRMRDDADLRVRGGGQCKHCGEIRCVAQTQGTAFDTTGKISLMADTNPTTSDGIFT